MILILALFQILPAWIAVAQSDCKWDCTDYHRLCPAVNDPAMYDEYKNNIANGTYPDLPKNVLSAPNCSDPQFALLCPMTCKTCTPCAEEHLNSLKATIAQGKSSCGVAAQPRRLQVTGFVSSQPKESGLAMDKAFQGGALRDDGDWTNCFISQSGYGRAVIDIEPAAVHKIRFLERQDCCSDRIKGIKVNVCVRGGSCERCGQPKEYGKGYWSTLQCENGPIEGNQVRIYHTSDVLQICELEIIGTALADHDIPFPLLDYIPVTSYSGEEFDDEVTLAKAFEGNSEANRKDCFMSKKQTVATIAIEQAAVHQVELLNRWDCCAGRMQGLKINVCNSESGCMECGKAPSTSKKGRWTWVKCENGPINGTEIQLSHPSDHVQFCEIRILGKTA